MGLIPDAGVVCCLFGDTSVEVELKQNFWKVSRDYKAEI